MTYDKIVECLCSYDERNPYPYYDKEYAKTPRTDCYCDNCFYRRDKLALELLRLSEGCKMIKRELSSYLADYIDYKVGDDNVLPDDLSVLQECVLLLMWWT